MKLNRKTEIIIGLLIIILIGSFIGYNLFKTSFQKDKTLEEIYKNEEENNIEELLKYIEMVDGEKLNKEELIYILDSLKEENLKLSSFNYIKEDSTIDEGKNGNNIYPIYTVKDGKDKLIYDKYKILFRYYDIALKTNLTEEDEFSILLNDKEIENPKIINNEIYIKNLKPGRYKMEIVIGNDPNNKYENELDLISYHSIDTNSDIYMGEEKNRENIIVEESLDISKEFLYLYSYIDKSLGESNLYINNEKTDIILNNEGYEYGPYYKGQNLILSMGLDIKGQVFKSKDINVDENINDEIYFYKEDIFIDDDKNYNIGELEGLVYDYMYDLVYAINYGNKSYLRSTIKEGSPLYKKQVDLVDRLYEKGTTEELLGYDIKSIKKIDGNKFELIINEQHKIYQYDGTTKKADNTWKYTVVTDDSGIYMYNLESTK